MILSFIAYLLFLNINYLLGRLAIQFIDIKDLKVKESTFVGLVVGLFISVFIYSIVKTEFTTISIFLIFPLFYYLLNKKKRISFVGLANLFNQINLSISIFVNLNIIAVVVFCVCVILNYINFKLGFSDDVFFYSGVSQRLNEGVENAYFAYQSILPNYKVLPYHYFELWLNSLIKSVFSLLSYSQVLVFVTYPLLVFTLILGLLSVLELHTKPKLKHLPLLIGLLFISPYLNRDFIQGLSSMYSGGTLFEMPGLLLFSNVFSFYGGKNIPIYIVFLLFIYFLLRRKEFIAFIVLSLLFVINIGLLPSVYGASVLFFLYKIYKKEKVKQYKQLVLFYTFTVISILIFYLHLGSYNTNVIGTVELNHFSGALNWKGELIYRFSRLFFAFILVTISYSPFLLFWIVYRKKIFRIDNLSLFLLLLFGVSLFSRVFLFGMDSLQFVTYIFPIINISIVVMFICSTVNVNAHFNKLVLFIIISLTIASIVQSLYESNNFSNNVYNVTGYAEDFEEHVLDELILSKELKNVPIGFLMGRKESRTLPLVWKYKMPGKFFYANDYFNLISLNYPYFEVNDYSKIYKRPTVMNHQSLFYEPATYSMKEFNFHLAQFVKKQKIKYVITSVDSEIPDFFNQFTEKKIIGKNEVFYVLNYNL